MPIYRYLMVLLSVRHMVDCFTWQNVSAPKRAFFSCKRGYKTYQQYVDMLPNLKILLSFKMVNNRFFFVSSACHNTIWRIPSAGKDGCSSDTYRMSYKDDMFCTPFCN